MIQFPHEVLSGFFVNHFFSEVGDKRNVQYMRNACGTGLSFLSFST